MIKKFLNLILLTTLVLGLTATFQQTLQGEWSRLFNQYFPCSRPIPYTVASFDDRFGISEKDFLDSVAEAEKIWEAAAGKNLFDNTAGEKVKFKINMIYDYRQEATNKLNNIGTTVSGTKASYDEVKAKYDSLQKTFKSDKARYQELVKDFKSKQGKYQAEVDSWNQRGGAPEKIYFELKAEADSLRKYFSNIKIIETNLNAKVDEINTLAGTLNKIAADINQNVSIFNDIGKSRGEEFTEGEYRTDASGEQINVFEFSTKERLVRLLAHEFGHALGIGHVADTEAIMYRLNSGAKNTLTTADIIALNAYCKTN